MAQIIDPQTGLLVDVPDTSLAARASRRATAQPPQAAPIVRQETTGGRGFRRPAEPQEPTPTQITRGQIARSSGALPPVAASAAAPTPVVATTQPPTQPPVVQAATPVVDYDKQVADMISAQPEEGVLQSAERGNYNQYNTDTGALARRAAASTPVVAATQTPTQPPAPTSTPEPQTNAAPLDIAALNRQVSERVTASRPEAGILQPAERGNYNQYNTDTGALARRAAQTSGINFGFGVNGAETAQQYLGRMRQQDAETAAARQQRVQAAQDDLARSSLARAAASGDPFERRAALLQLSALEQRATGREGLANELQRTRLTTEAEANRANVAAQGALAAAQARAVGTTQAAALGRDATLQAARIRALGGIAQEEVKAESPQGLLAQQRATAVDLANQAVQDAAAAGDIETVVALLGGGRPAQSVSRDPVTGAALTPEIESLLQKQMRDRLMQQVGQ